MVMVCDTMWHGMKKKGAWQYTGDAERNKNGEERIVTFNNTKAKPQAGLNCNVMQSCDWVHMAKACDVT